VSLPHYGSESGGEREREIERDRWREILLVEYRLASRWGESEEVRDVWWGPALSGETYHIEVRRTLLR
jgi:hypothetical protein